MLMWGVESEYHLLGIILLLRCAAGKISGEVSLFIYSIPTHIQSTCSLALHFLPLPLHTSISLSDISWTGLGSGSSCPGKRLASSWRRFRRSRPWRMICWGRISAMVLDMGNIRSRIAHRRVTSLEVNYNSLALLCSKRQRLKRCRLHSRVA